VLQEAILLARGLLSAQPEVERRRLTGSSKQSPTITPTAFFGRIGAVRFFRSSPRPAYAQGFGGLILSPPKR